MSDDEVYFSRWEQPCVACEQPRRPRLNLSRYCRRQILCVWWPTKTLSDPGDEIAIGLAQCAQRAQVSRVLPVDRNDGPSRLVNRKGCPHLGKLLTKCEVLTALREILLTERADGGDLLSDQPPQLDPGSAIISLLVVGQFCRLKQRRLKRIYSAKQIIPRAHSGDLFDVHAGI